MTSVEFPREEFEKMKLKYKNKINTSNFLI